MGLNNCVLINVGVGDSKYGLRIAEAGVDGRGISFISCNATQAYYGFKQNADSCSVNMIGGGCYENVYAYWVNKGFLCVNGAINAGIYNAADPTFPGQTDILHNSTGITTFIGGRSEFSEHPLYNCG